MMKISKKLPQFEKPALFIAAGEYEADFWIAENGILDLERRLKLPPRTEAKEKQGFIGHRSIKKDLSAVSHRGRYIEDLKRKFKKQVHEIIHDILAEYKLKEIYIFTPKYVAKRIESCLSKPERKDIRMEFFEEDTKLNALDMVEKFWQQEQKNIFPPPMAKNNVKKILSRKHLRDSTATKR